METILLICVVVFLVASTIWEIKMMEWFRDLEIRIMKLENKK